MPASTTEEKPCYSKLLGTLGLLSIGLAVVLGFVFFDELNRSEVNTISGLSGQFSVLQVFPHDSSAFTQGLIFHDGYLYESTGLRQGRSSLRKVNITTGEALELVRTIDVVTNRVDYFAEGLCKIGNRLLQLTWQSKKLIIYDFDSLEVLEERTFSTSRNEGWGIAFSNDTKYFQEPQLVVSDGSNVIHFWDPVTFEETKRIFVFDPESGNPIKNLNELEFVKGELLANIWYSDKIVRIDINTGEAIGYFDFGFQNLPFDSHGDVLNGIAYDASTDETYITGKLWKYMVKVKLF